MKYNKREVVVNINTILYNFAKIENLQNDIKKATDNVSTYQGYVQTKTKYILEHNTKMEQFEIENKELVEINIQENITLKNTKNSKNNEKDIISIVKRITSNITKINNNNENIFSLQNQIQDFYKSISEHKITINYYLNDISDNKKQMDKLININLELEKEINNINDM